MAQTGVPADHRDADDGEVARTLAALATPAGQRDPYPLYARLHSVAPAAVGPDGALVVAGYAQCSAMLKDHRLKKFPARLLTVSGYPDWQDHPALKMMFGSMLMINPPEHTRIRRAVSSAFTPGRAAALRPAIARITEELCNGLDGMVDFVGQFAFAFPVTVIGELLGIPAADRPMFQGLVRDWSSVLEMLSPVAVDQADVAATQIRDYLADLAALRRSRPADDLMSALVTAADPLPEDDLLSTAVLLLGAGFETTTGLLANGLLALLEQPRRGRPAPDRPGRTRAGRGRGTPAVRLARPDAPRQDGTGGPDHRRADGAGGHPGVDDARCRQPRPHRLRRSRPTGPTAERATAVVIRRRVHYCWAHRWPASRHRSRCHGCCNGSRTCGWPESPCRARGWRYMGTPASRSTLGSAAGIQPTGGLLGRGSATRTITRMSESFGDVAPC